MEGYGIPRFQKESLELRAEIVLEGFIAGGEDGDLRNVVKMLVRPDPVLFPGEVLGVHCVS